MHLHVHIHIGEDDPVLVALHRIEAKMATNTEVQQQILQGIADTKAEVTAERTVVGSAVALLQGLAARIADLLAQGQSGALDPTQILAGLAELKSAVDANKDDLAAAVVANTPA